MADIADRKRILRAKAAELRQTVHVAHAGPAAFALRDHFLDKVPLPPRASVGGYWPIGTEIDVRPLLTALHARGHVCGLPIAHRGQPLAFHRWLPDDELVTGRFDIRVPKHTHPTFDPDALIVPMLAFDAYGMRIGYGGGYYDRTIADIRSRKKLLTAGVAYATQQIEQAPADEFDQPLDWLVTEKGARLAERRRFPWLRRFLTS